MHRSSYAAYRCHIAHKTRDTMLRLPFARPYRPVAHFLNALVLACLLPGIIGLAIFVLVDYRDEHRRLREDNIQSASLLGHAIDEHLLRAQALAASLAESGDVASSDLDALAEHAADSVAATAAGSRIDVYKIDGGRLLGKIGATGGWIAREGGAHAVRHAFSAGRATISGVAIDPVSGRPAVNACVPVVREGLVRYVLAVVIPTAQLNEIILQRNYPAGWLASLLDSNGTIAGRNRDADRFVGVSTDPRQYRARTRNASGAFETVTQDGVPNLVAFSRSAQTGFTTVIGVPQAQLAGQLHNKLLLLSATAGMLFSIGWLLARYMSRRIAGSIHALTRPAIALGEGRPQAVTRVHLSEAAEVGAAIGRAAELLQRREAALRAQQEQLQRFEFFSENSNEILLLLDTRGQIRYANRRACTRLGYARAELLSMTIFQLDLPCTQALLDAAFDEACRNRIPSFERVYRCRDGSEFPVEISATVLEHRGEWLMHVAPRDIGERRRAEESLRWAATHDALTGTANRARLLAHLDEVLAGTDGGSTAGALLYIDLDRFKPVNDLYGHEVGDRVLRELAARFQGCLQRADLLARVGGDEFVAVLRAGAADAARTAAAVAAAAARPVRLGNIEVVLSAAIGISRFPDHGDKAGMLVHAADMAMLKAKHGGRGAIACYCPDMGTQAQFVLAVERRLQQALDNDGFALHYQPIVDIGSGMVEGVEALVRLEDGIEPALGPAAFIPVAESCGLIAPLGDWVAREACRQQVRWERAGIALTVAVNVSALQFQRKDFAARIQDLIASSGIRPRSLVIELTESALMENVAEAVAILHRLKALGVRIALDDFGTGYSSLSSLSTLPLDKLKIDQSFVRGIDTDRASRAVIDAVIALADSLGLALVAEGIETASALAWLRERGCHQGQGYYFSRPLPRDRVPGWIGARAVPLTALPAPAAHPALQAPLPPPK